MARKGTYRTVRVEKALYQAIAKVAARERRTVQAHINAALAAHVAAENQPQQAA